MVTSKTGATPSYHLFNANNFVSASKCVGGTIQIVSTIKQCKVLVSLALEMYGKLIDMHLHHQTYIVSFGLLQKNCLQAAVFCDERVLRKCIYKWRAY